MINGTHVVHGAVMEPRVARQGIATLRATVEPPRDGWLAYMGQHGKSFHFASQFMPAHTRERIAAIYAYCRFTDDLVDAPGAIPAIVEPRLDAWLTLTRLAYEGIETGIPLLTRAMHDARSHAVPLRHIEDLVEGVRMDLRRVRYADRVALRLYTHRVASTVGLWLTESFGIHDSWMLDRAATLGHAMQLTNILRDVGADLTQDRVYLPADRMAAHGVSIEQLDAALNRGAELPEGYSALLEELMQEAEDCYRHAWDAIAELPTGFRHATAVASRVYAAIHDEIRMAGYDNLHRRVWVSTGRKALLATRALYDLAGSPSWRSRIPA